MTQVGERIWLLTFMQSELAYFDDDSRPPTPPLASPNVVEILDDVGLLRMRDGS